MAIQPTGTQIENDDAMRGLTHMNKTADGSPVDPNTPPFSQALPVNVTLPVVTGPSPPVVGSTLQSSPGVWNYNGLKLAYQWLRASSPIAGATGTSYTTVTADKTNTISCMVTATNAKGTTPATSAATVAVP